ncbi:MAG: outer membrane beta-barrel protein [bacterium]
MKSVSLKATKQGSGPANGNAVRRNAANIAGVVVVAAVLGAATLATSAPARADTQGFAFGLDMHSSVVGTVDEKPGAPPGTVFIKQDGGGARLWLGYGITPSFPVRVVFSGARHNTTDPDVHVDLGSVTLESLYLFRNPAAFRPYLLGGVGGYSVKANVNDYDYETTGPGVTLGGGLMYFFANTFAIDLGLRADFINWDRRTATRTAGDGSQVTVETPVKDDGGAGSVHLGVSWWL